MHEASGNLLAAATLSTNAILPAPDTQNSLDGNKNISVVDFTYNRPRPNDNQAPNKESNYLQTPYFSSDIITAGGNYMTDGYGIAASSSLIYEENNLSTSQVNAQMEEYYGVHTYHVVDDPNNTYIDHIDCWGKYLSPHKVLIREVPSWHAQYDEIEEVADYFANTTTIYGELWEVYRVYTSSNQPYTNSLILNDKVFHYIFISQPWIFFKLLKITENYLIGNFTSQIKNEK